MKNKELFDKTVDVLVKAYQNDELEHGDCSACAVGNICKEASKITGVESGAWGYLFSTFKSQTDNQFIQLIASNNEEIVSGDKILNIKEKALRFHYQRMIKYAFQLIDSTGYSLNELCQIEYAFETANKGENKDEWMFNGLIAVYDVLCEIHEVDKKEVEEAELIFVKV